METVDVVLLTKNSVYPDLEGCLRSITRNIPVNRLLAIDGGSSDGTLDILKTFGADIIHDSGNRATARQKGIELAETEWFMFVDSDVILCDNWYSRAKQHLASKVGAVWGAALPSGKTDAARYRAMSKFYGKSEIELAVKAGQKRGLTHDTLIRTSAVKDIKIPVDLTVLEDHYIRQHVESKGYDWLAVSDPYCLHYAHSRERAKDYLQFGYCGRKTGYVPFRTIMLYTVLGVPKSAWILLITRDGSAAYTQLKTYFFIVLGWLKA